MQRHVFRRVSFLIKKTRCFPQYNNRMQKRMRVFFVMAVLISRALITPAESTAQSTTMLALISPGEGSRLTSPIHIIAEIQNPGPGLIRLALVDAKGIVLARQLLRLPPTMEEAHPFESWLFFEMPEPSLSARLTVSLHDTTMQTLSLRSVNLTLSAEGEDQTLPNANLTAWLTLDFPTAHTQFDEGKVHAVGTVIPLNNNPVIFDLVTDTGGVVGTLQLPVTQTGQPQSFDINIPYAFITKARSAMLVIRQVGKTQPGNVILDSLPIILIPPSASE